MKTAKFYISYGRTGRVTGISIAGSNGSPIGIKSKYSGWHTPFGFIDKVIKAAKSDSNFRIEETADGFRWVLLRGKFIMIESHPYTNNRSVGVGLGRAKEALRNPVGVVCKEV